MDSTLKLWKLTCRDTVGNEKAAGWSNLPDIERAFHSTVKY